MARSYRSLLIFLTCAILAVVQPRLLDRLRYPLAWVFSAPLGRLTDSFHPEPDVPSDAGAERRALYADWLASRAPDGETVPVIWASSSGRTLIVGRGWCDGVSRGQAVAAGGVLLGFVDRVEAELARVRLTSHPECRMGGLVEIDGGGDARFEPILLRGADAGVAVPQRGSAIDAGLVGARVFMASDGHLPRGLLLGNVARMEGFGVVVRLAVDSASVDRVALFTATGASLPRTASRLYRSIDAVVTSSRDALAGSRSWSIDAGTLQGVEEGAVVTVADRIVGRIARVGLRTARVTPFAGEDAGLDLLWIVRDEDGAIQIGPRAAAAAAGSWLVRGRGTGAPGGLWWPHEPGDLVRDLDPGTPVLVHVFGPRRDLLRLGGR